MLRKLALLCTVSCVIGGPAMAEPYTYAPDGCEVTSTFPEKPFIQTKCTETSGKKECTDVVSFTKTAADTGSSINFRITCNVTPTTELEKYTLPIIEETLRQMTKASNMEAFDVNTSENGGFKKGAVMSTGLRNDKGVIYSGQIWVGKNSIFTMESEMIGPKNGPLETMFVDILRNTRAKDAPPAKPAETKAEKK